MALTKKDLNEIAKLIDQALDKKLDQSLSGLENKINFRFSQFRDEMFEHIDIKLTETKSEFFDRVDPILKEVLIARDERLLIENRIEKLEEIHAHGKHSIAL